MDVAELYQQVILDHNRAPRNFRMPEGTNRKALGHNPLCGDQLTVFLNVSDDGLVEDIGFQGEGCAISKASASLMTDAVKGKTVEEAEKLFEAFHSMVAEDAKPDRSALGKLVAFQGVKEFPVRVKCATLCWHTLHNAIENKEESVAVTE